MCQIWQIRRLLFEHYLSDISLHRVSTNPPTHSSALLLYTDTLSFSSAIAFLLVALAMTAAVVSSATLDHCAKPVKTH